MRHQYLCSAYSFMNHLFLVLTWHFSVDYGVLGRLVRNYSRPSLNLLIQTYDYACSLYEEWTFLFRSRWTKVKGLYIITRHAPFVLLSTELVKFFTPDKCLMSLKIHFCLGIISVICSEFFFVLRTYALWSNNRIVLAAVLTTFLAVTVASIVAGFITVGASRVIVTTNAILGITDCYWSLAATIQFLLLFVFQLGLFCLTLIRVIQSWRTNNGPLYSILVKHNIFYYASGLFLTVLNFLISIMFANSAYRSLFESFEVTVLTILATRMHLHLWRMDRDAHGSDALGMICLSDMFSADLMAY
ncbi:hypothetical protein DEU56DRAFT_65542 [Suillus clintonianus]|uniref:uncharacterized protein n=1 Tax=Suillus clintonianus TaxID=1904413 RepID=UPI001B886CC8|nr:uncharacterized protein DEU56DRAFT_65542 [Suillus clintonianus]KAG2123079.1 hypothetical protein DEU56DRAFT_65542 [Suillus clintonianus]